MDVLEDADEVRVVEEERGICGADHMVLQTKSLSLVDSNLVRVLRRTIIISRGLGAGPIS